jgi:hypothetical protein
MKNQQNMIFQTGPLLDFAISGQLSSGMDAGLNIATLHL